LKNKKAPPLICKGRWPIGRRGFVEDFFIDNLVEVQPPLSSATLNSFPSLGRRGAFK